MIKKLLQILKKRLPQTIGTAVGLIAGYLYYRFVGCATGACLITANPILSTLYGGFIGGVIGSMIQSGGCCACITGKCGIVPDNDVKEK
ncbi:MAG: hypothetical protein ACOYI8_08355 [Christensenellales bacterium]